MKRGNTVRFISHGTPLLGLKEDIVATQTRIREVAAPVNLIA